jgi:hypothetical protein
LDVGVDQLFTQCIYASLSALATTLEDEIRTKVDSRLAPLRAYHTIMQRKVQSTKACLSSMEHKVASSLPSASLGGVLYLTLFVIYEQHDFHRVSLRHQGDGG